MQGLSGFQDLLKPRANVLPTGCLCCTRKVKLYMDLFLCPKGNSEGGAQWGKDKGLAGSGNPRV